MARAACLEGGAIGKHRRFVGVDTTVVRLVVHEASVAEACAKGGIAPRVQDVRWTKVGGKSSRVRRPFARNRRDVTCIYIVCLCVCVCVCVRVCVCVCMTLLFTK